MTRRATAEKVTAMPQRPRAGELLLGRHWYMRPDALQGLRVLAEKRLGDPAALTTWADAAVPDTYFATVRDGIAYVPISGPMDRTWSFWSWLFGGATYDVLAVEMQRLRDNAAIRATVLQFDTPGGVVNGCGELAGIIAQCDAVKPVFAHAVGDCCSAGYYLASATRQIYVDRAAIVGSIGVCATFIDTSGLEEQLGIEFIDMVSTQSPRKNADPTTESGRADWQDLLDSLAAVFITDVAQYRGVDEETVLADFGQGGVFVGQQAIDAGLADMLGTTDALHETLIAALDAGEFTNDPESTMPAAATRTRPKGSVNPATRTKAEDETPEDDKEKEKKAEDMPPDDDEEDDDEEAIDSMVSFSFPTGYSAVQQAEAFAATYPDAARTLSERGATAERERIAAIHELGATVSGNAKAQKLIADAMKDPKQTADTVARSILKAGVATGSAALAARKGDEEQLDPPSNSDDPNAAQTDEDKAVSFLKSVWTPAKPAK